MTGFPGKRVLRTLAQAGAWLVLIAALTRVPTVRAGTTVGSPAGVATADSPRTGADVRALPDSVPDTGGLAENRAPGPPHDYAADVLTNFTPENRAYASRRAALGFVGPLYGVAVGLLLLFSGLAARMRDVAHALGHRRYVRLLVFFILYAVAGFALTFPLDWYQGFALEHQFGLSNQSFGAWLADSMKGQVVEIVFLGVIPLLSLAYGAIEKSPRWWWLWLSIGTLPVIVLSLLIGPIVIEPLFNKFTPLKNQQLKHEILDLAARADIPSRNVYQVDKSRQTSKFNAYVTGFGASQRIVLWDTTLEGMQDDEILFVMGHEMGHYKLGHDWKGALFASALSLAVFYLCFVWMRWSVVRWGGRWGFRDLHDVASLPLFAVVLSLISLVALPAFNAFSRGIEHEADGFGLEVTHLNDAAARAFIKLGSQNKSNPEPGMLLRVFEYSHPPLLERVRYAERYRPWERGEPARYFKPVP